jgi:hypothetical protein
MAEQMSKGGLDFEALRRSIEQRDIESLVELYADDAEYQRIHRNSTPSSPMVVRGKEEIAQYWRDVLGRQMSHRVQDEVIAEERIAFNDAWRVSGRYARTRGREPRGARRQDRSACKRAGLGRVAAADQRLRHCKDGVFYTPAHIRRSVPRDSNSAL